MTCVYGTILGYGSGAWDSGAVRFQGLGFRSDENDYNSAYTRLHCKAQRADTYTCTYTI